MKGDKADGRPLLTGNIHGHFLKNCVDKASVEEGLLLSI